MKIYLSSDNRNDLFVNTVKAITDTHSYIELIYPPRRWGDTGNVVRNVLRIIEADLVLMDITPNVHSLDGGGTCTKYNEGVLIEYGIALALDNQSGVPWGGKLLKPSWRIFCAASFSRSNLTPIVNTASVVDYRTDDNGSDLSTKIRAEINAKVQERMTIEYKYNPSPTNLS